MQSSGTSPSNAEVTALNGAQIAAQEDNPRIFEAYERGEQSLDGSGQVQEWWRRPRDKPTR